MAPPSTPEPGGGGRAAVPDYFRLLFERNPQPMWLYDVETLAFLEVNDAALAQYGYAREEMLALTLRDIRPESELPRLEAVVAETRDGLALTGVWRHRRKDGSELDVEVAAHGMELAGRRVRLVAVHDVTARVRAERELAESRRRFQELVENLNEVVLEVSVDGTFTYVSPAVEPILGRRAEELVGHEFLEFVAPEDRQRVLESVAELLTRGRVEPLDYRVVGREGERIWARSQGRPILRGGEIVGFRAAVADVTSLKRAEVELESAREQLFEAQKMEAIGRLAGGIAHDFNNMLTVVQGHAELVREELAAAGRDLSSADEILGATARAAQLTRQLLAFGRGQLLRPEAVDVNEVVRDVGRLLGRTLGEDVDVRLDLDPAVEPVYVEPRQLHQVLLNLAMNSRDAMPRGGRLSLRTGMRELGGEQAAAARIPPGCYVEVEVEDDGHGIPESIRDSVFEPFFTTKEVGQGSGLGLSTVYGILRQSGGGVELESVEGEGTRVRCFLPRAAR